MKTNLQCVFSLKQSLGNTRGHRKRKSWRGIYNLGGHNERNILYIVKRILSELGKPESLIEFVPDRHGHDQRYAIDPAKANKELGWDPITTFEVGIKKTIEWYLSEKGSAWLDECMKQNQEWF